jgi:uncharacterized protein (DUF2062 family)
MHLATIGGEITRGALKPQKEHRKQAKKLETEQQTQAAAEAEAAAAAAGDAAATVPDLLLQMIYCSST